MKILKYFYQKCRYIYRKLFSKTKNLMHVGTGCDIPQRQIELNGNNIYIGDFVSIGPGCRFDLAPSVDIKIGSGTVIAPRCTFYTRTHVYDRQGLESIPYDHVNYAASISIGEGSWLGDGVIVLPGVKIGKGVVIGAGSVVAKDIPDYAVIVGNPARIIKYRDEKRFVELLNERKFRLNVNSRNPKKKHYILDKNQIQNNG